MGQISRGRVQHRCCQNVPLAVLTLLGGGGLSGGQSQVHLFYQIEQKFRLDVKKFLTYFKPNYRYTPTLHAKEINFMTAMGRNGLEFWKGYLGNEGAEGVM